MQQLIKIIRKQYKLDFLKGVHGISHWARLYTYGNILCDGNSNIDRKVVSMFSIFHDSCRLNDHDDPGHGKRSCKLLENILPDLGGLNIEQYTQLYYACGRHTFGTPDEVDDVTILTCWDIDRLDLYRVGNYPDPKLLCTPAARDKDLIWRCSELAEHHHVYHDVINNWGVDI